MLRTRIPWGTNGSQRDPGVSDLRLEIERTSRPNYITLHNWEAYKVNSGDTIENKSKRLITLILDVLEPKIRTFENPTDPSLVRDIQIINDIAMSKETNIPKSISYRPM